MDDDCSYRINIASGGKNDSIGRTQFKAGIYDIQLVKHAYLQQAPLITSL